MAMPQIPYVFRRVAAQAGPCGDRHLPLLDQASPAIEVRLGPLRLFDLGKEVLYATHENK